MAELDRQAAVILAVVFPGQQYREVFGRQEFEVRAARKLAGIVDIVAGKFVDWVTVAVDPANRDAGTDAIGNLAADRSLADQVEVIATNRRANVALQLVAGLGGNQVYRTAGGIAALERALRTAKHFDAFKIEHRTKLCLGERYHRAINMQRDRRVDPGKRARKADAPDEQLCEVEVVAETDRRDNVLQRLDTGCTAPLKGVAIDCRN